MNENEKAIVAGAPPGQKTARTAAAAAGAGGGFALVMLIVQRLTPEALERVLVNLGAPMIFSLVLLFLGFRFGNRALSLMFQNTKHVAGLDTGMNALAGAVAEVARRDDQRSLELDHTVNLLAERSDAVRHKLDGVQRDVIKVGSQVTEMHGMLERIAREYDKEKEARA